MRVCIDTNVLVQLFGRNAPCAPIKDALVLGRIELAVATAMLLEYEEIVIQLLGPGRWQQFEELFARLFRLHALYGSQDGCRYTGLCPALQKTEMRPFVITEDPHFKVLTAAGYKPQPIAPAEFNRPIPCRKDLRWKP